VGEYSRIDLGAHSLESKFATGGEGAGRQRGRKKNRGEKGQRRNISQGRNAKLTPLLGVNGHGAQKTWEGQPKTTGPS